MKSMRAFLPALLMVTAVSCNQFPPISGRDAEEANDIAYSLQDALKAVHADEGVTVYCRGGNQVNSLFVYGIRDTTQQSWVVQVVQKHMEEHQLRKETRIQFFDQKEASGKDGHLLSTRMIPGRPKQ